MDVPYTPYTFLITNRDKKANKENLMRQKELRGIEKDLLEFEFHQQLTLPTKNR